MKAKFAVFGFLGFFACFIAMVVMDVRKSNHICLGCLFCQGKNFLGSMASDLAKNVL